LRRILFISLAAILALSIGLIGCEGEGEDIGDPVTVKFLIRNEDQRLDIGDYVGNQLEDLGFTVVRQYGTSGDLSPLWYGSDPADGLWNVYTGAWINTAVPRDEGYNFGQFYTPLWSAMGPLWAAYTPTDEFLAVATALWNADFSTMAEREALFEDAVPMSMNDSARVFLDDRTSFYMQQKDVALAADAYGGTEGSRLWAHSIHFRDGSGVPLVPTGNTTLRAATSDLLVEPWNPIAGSNWAYDQMPISATQDRGFMYDVNDGLCWPQVAEKAEVTVMAGLPVGTTAGHDWCTLATTPDPIPVPATAWADWDADAGDWVLAGSGVTAKTKTVVYYPAGTFGRPLHDGSTLDEGDFLFYTIQQFDRAQPTSDIYDLDYVAEYDAFMSHFKGFTFNFTAPGYDLVVTTYDDQFQLDAELMAFGNQWFPTGSYGPYAWHTMALGYLAEKDLQLAFSEAKATAEGIEQLGMTSGPSLAILESYLDAVRDGGDPLAPEDFIPYPNVIGSYVTAGEAGTRYDNLEAFWAARNHFWVASGPYFLHSVDTVGDVVRLDRWGSYPDSGDTWFFLMDPEPTTPPVHDGGWMDTIVLGVLDELAAFSQLQSDDLDIYIHGESDADLFADVQADADLHYYVAYGLFDELTFNPSGPFFPNTGELNPFAIHAVRRALNFAIDRSYIAGEIYGGMAAPRYTCVGTVTGDYINRYPALFAATNAEYAYDFDLADDLIEAEMLAIPGVTRHTDGLYYYLSP
jgi:peptide/nickel transport system substrate-binding protein